jgi:hypothetical protein
MLSKGKVATRLPPTTLIGRGHSIPRNSGSTRSKIAKVDCATSAQVASLQFELGSAAIERFARSRGLRAALIVAKRHGRSYYARDHSLSGVWQ